jgi:guanylate kinase
VTREGSGLLYVVSGPSGTGKTTLCKELIKRIPDLSFSISYTTRPRRRNEKSDKDYYFVTPEAFKDMINKGEFAEWAEIYGNSYGTSRSSIEEALNKGHDLIFDIDSQGARQLKRTYPLGISIFLLPPSVSELERRLCNRKTDSQETIRKRMNKARQEISQVEIYEYIVINNVLEKTLHVLQSIIVAEKHRRENMARKLSLNSFQK